MADSPPLPARCSECVFHPAQGDLCRRHAPAPGQESFEVAKWPLVRPNDRCGAGAAVGNGDGPGITPCGWCIHWLRPDDEGVKPDYRQGLSRDWWDQSGYCTRHAPSPSSEEGRRTNWRVTGAHDGCGDGERIEETAA